MKTYFNDHGLLVDSGTVCGYIFNFNGQAFSPDGKVQLQNGTVRDLTQSEIDTHNRLLAEAEIAGLDNCKVGQWGTFYWSQAKGVTTWTGLKVADYSLSGQVLTFKRNGKTFRGRTRKDADCFNFKRVA